MVRRNDEITPDQIESNLPSRILISPGPGRPADAGISLELISCFSGRVPILGVCLGHQAIGQVFGGRVVRAATVVHGKASEIKPTRSIFKVALARQACVVPFGVSNVKACRLPEVFCGTNERSGSWDCVSRETDRGCIPIPQCNSCDAGQGTFYCQNFPLR